MTTKPDPIDLGALQREMLDARAEMWRRDKQVQDAYRHAREWRERWLRACDAYYAAKEAER